MPLEFAHNAPLAERLNRQVDRATLIFGYALNFLSGAYDEEMPWQKVSPYVDQAQTYLTFWADARAHLDGQDYSELHYVDVVRASYERLRHRREYTVLGRLGRTSLFGNLKLRYLEGEVGAVYGLRKTAEGANVPAYLTGESYAAAVENRSVILPSLTYLDRLDINELVIMAADT